MNNQELFDDLFEVYRCPVEAKEEFIKILTAEGLSLEDIEKLHIVDALGFNIFR